MFLHNLPTQSPWLNPIEPKWVHGKRAVVEPDGLLSAEQLAERIVARPLLIVGTSILQVFLGEAGKTVSSDPAKLKSRFYQVTTRQFGIALIWIVTANLLAAALFPLAFGAKWSEGVEKMPPPPSHSLPSVT